MEDQAFKAALASLAAAPDTTNFSEPFASLFPVSGAAVSTLGELLGSETLSASDETAIRLDELQFDLGEGPCWDAMNQARPVAASDMSTTTRWPAFTEAIRQYDVTSVFAYPVRVGTLRIGAVDLYSRSQVHLAPDQSEKASGLAAEVGRQVLRRALQNFGGDYVDDLNNAYSRRLIHQATGMVLVQLRLSADDARLVIQGHAFAKNRPMMEVAQDILDGRLDFSRDSTSGEDSP